MSEHDAIVKVKLGSERNFGIVIGCVLAIIAFWPLFHGGAVRLVWLAPAVLTVAAGLFVPRWLYWPNRVWFRFGLLLGAVIAPIVMFLVYLTTFVPMGTMLRVLGKDLLSLHPDPKATSYWIVREQKPQSMTRQF